MSDVKCVLCGGTLEISETGKTGVCSKCGETAIIPYAKSEENRILFDMAQQYQRICAFDRAEECCRRIIETEPDNSDALWGIVLCKFCIKIDFDENGFKIYSYSKMHDHDITDDEDYKKAYQLGDDEHKTVYYVLAEKMKTAAVRSVDIVADNIDNCDVFISFVKADKDFPRTQDEILAGVLEHQLTLDGFNVYSGGINISNTNEDPETEKITALNTALVMIVIGSKAEYYSNENFSSEWRSFISSSKNEKYRKILVLFKNFPVSELPDELSGCEIEDISVQGFVHNIVQHVKRMMTDIAENVIVNDDSRQITIVENVSVLLDMAFSLLEDGEWNKAEILLGQVISRDPTNSKAYLGRLMAELNVAKEADLIGCHTSFAKNINFQQALKYSATAKKGVLLGYNQSTNDQLYGDLYNLAVQKKMHCVTRQGFLQLAEEFRRMDDYKDSKAYVKECLYHAALAEAEQEYDKTIAKYNILIRKENPSEKDIRILSKTILEFETMGDYKDALYYAEKGRDMVCSLNARYKVKKTLLMYDVIAAFIFTLFSIGSWIFYATNAAFVIDGRQFFIISGDIKFTNGFAITTAVTSMLVVAVYLISMILAWTGFHRASALSLAAVPLIIGATQIYLMYDFVAKNVEMAEIGVIIAVYALPAIAALLMGVYSTVSNKLRKKMLESSDLVQF